MRFGPPSLVLGLLGIPSLCLQVWKGWPPSLNDLRWFGLQAVLLFVFVAYGLGIAYQTPAETGDILGASESGDPPPL